MMKMNLKKMVMAAAMAAFMVYAPAMAEEDIILDETTEMAAEIIGTAAETEAAELLVDVQIVAEVPAEVAEAAEQAQTGANAEAMTQAMTQSFFFENDEVVIRAEAAELPAGAQMAVTKLEEGSAAYEEAKAAAEAVYGADENAEYVFYSVIFTVDGEETESSAEVQVEFKTAKTGSAQQNVMEIEDGAAQDVTAQTAEGSNVSSVNFEI